MASQGGWKVSPLDVCSSCKAEPGQPCRTPWGEARETHFVRTRDAFDAIPKAQPAPVKLGPARLAHAITKEAESRGVSIVYLGEYGAPADPDRHGIDYWIWHVCSHAEVKIEARGRQHNFSTREASALLDGLKGLPVGLASRDAAERLLPLRRT